MENHKSVVPPAESDDLPASVDAERGAEIVPGQRSEVRHFAFLPQEGMTLEDRGTGDALAHHLSAVVDGGWEGVHLAPTEGPEIGHHTVPPNEAARMNRVMVGGRIADADDLAGVVDIDDSAETISGQLAEHGERAVLP